MKYGTLRNCLCKLRAMFVLTGCVPLRLFFKIFGKLTLLNGGVPYLFDERSTLKKYEHLTFEVARFDSTAV